MVCGYLLVIVNASILLVVTRRVSLTMPTGAVARMHTTHAQKLDENLLTQMKSWQVIFFVFFLGMRSMHSCHCDTRCGYNDV